MVANTSQPKQALYLVNAERDIIAIFSALFEKECQVVINTDGKQILDQVTQLQPDVIILDTGMQGMNAVEECFFLKSETATSAIPVLFMSKGAAKDLQHGFHVGAADYIFKPFNTDLLKARVKVHLAYRHASALLHRHHQRHEVTQLPNREYFQQVLNKEWFHNVRCHQNVSLILLQIDHFADINDIYGETVIHALQRGMSKLLQSHCHRAHDFIAQLSAGNFAILISAEEHESLCIFAERLRAAVASNDFQYPGQSSPIRLTASLSLVSVCPDLSLQTAVNCFMSFAEHYLQQALNAGDTVVNQQLSNLQLIRETTRLRDNNPLGEEKPLS